MAGHRASPPEAKSLRLFVAVDVSPEAADAVGRAIEPWTKTFPKARWVPRENWHITLKFLGQTASKLEGWVHERVGDAARAGEAVVSSLTHLGSFPSSRRARVLWAGVEDPAGALGRIAIALDEGLRGEFRPEPRGFSPHLTVARSDPPLRLPDGFAATVLDPIPFTIERLVLYRSHLRRPAPVYEPLVSFPLRVK